MTILKKFIKDNKLKFEPGNRNNPLVTLTGFALYKNLTVQDCKEAIPKTKLKAPVAKELERIFSYGEKNKYGDWWATADAKKQYKF